MRGLVAVAVGVSVAACAGGGAQPPQFSRPVPEPASQALTCANQELERMGYTVAATDPSAGRVVGVVRNDPPWWLRMVGFRETADQLTVTVAQGEMRVTAISTDPVAERGSPGGVSRAAQQQAQSLLNACAART
jgi:hypothetical protein